MQNLPIKFPNKKGILVLTPTLLKYMSLSLNKFKLGFCADTYLPFGPKSHFLLFIFSDVKSLRNINPTFQVKMQLCLRSLNFLKFINAENVIIQGVPEKCPFIRKAYLQQMNIYFWDTWYIFHWFFFVIFN